MESKESLESVWALVTSLWKNLPKAVSLFDGNCRYLIASQGFYDWTGLSEEELKGSRLVYDSSSICIVGADDHDLLTGDAEAVETGSYRITGRKDGNSFLQLVSFHTDDFTGFIMLIDVSDRLRDAVALMESEERYRTLVENTFDAICIYRDGHMVYASDKTVKLFGYDLDELYAMDLWALYHPDDRALGMEMSRKRLSSQQIIEPYTARMVTRHGEIVHIEINGNLVTYQGEPAVLIVGRDLTQSMAMKQALRDRDIRLRNIIEHADGIIYTLNNDGFITYASPAWEWMLGHAVNEVEGRFFGDFVHPDDVQYCLCIMNQIKDEKLVRNEYSYRVYDSAGRIHWHRSRGSVVFDEKGDIDYFIGIANDVTEQKEAHDSLQLLGSIVNQSADAIISLNPDGTIASWNQGAAGIFGYTSLEVKGQPLLMLIDPRDYQLLETEMDCIRNNEAVEPISCRGITKEGTIIELFTSLSGIRGEIGNLTALALIARDVTAHRRSQSALEASEEKYRKVVHYANDAIMLAYLKPRLEECQFLEVNDVAVGMFGYSREELLAIGPYELARAGAKKVLTKEQIGQFLEGGRIGFETVLYTKDGQAVETEISAHSFDLDGEKVILGVVRDVSERKQSERKISELNRGLERRVEERTAQLQRVNDELESFAYSVSHDLRAPLRAIEGFSRILEEDYGPGMDDEGRRLLGVVRGNAERMQTLIEDLLAFSRMTRRLATMSKINMSILVQEVIAEYSSEPANRKVRFVVDELHDIYGDRAMIKQVLNNLIGNAIKFTRPVKEPLIMIHSCLQVNAGSGKPEKVFAVVDNGVGFDAAYKSKLFKVFQRLHHEQEFEGTGVGLAICKRIIERHGGHIWAESELERGSRFYFSIPDEESASV